MKYKYLVSGFYGMNNGQTGFSENVVENDRKLNTIENINEIREVIKCKHNFENLIILNIIRLKK